MKTSAIVRIIIWSVVAVLLCGVLIAGLSSHFSWSFLENIGLSWSSFRYDEQGYSIGDFQTDAEIHTLNIHWIGGSVHFTISEDDSVAVEEKSSKPLDEDDRMRYKVDGGVLTIRARKSGMFFGIGKKLSKDLTVAVPKELAGKLTQIAADCVSASVSLSDMTVQTLQIDTVSGNISIQNSKIGSASFDSVSGRTSISDCTVDSISCDSTSGSVTCNSVSANSLEMNSTSGRCKFSGAVKKVDADTVSGSVEIDSSTEIERFESDTVSGSVLLRIPDSNGFTAKLDSVSGDFNCNAPVTSSKSSRTYADGSANFNFDSVSGDVTIQLVKQESAGNE